MNINIKQAIDIESKYLIDKLGEKEYIPLITQLEDLGYANLSDYFNDKKYYLIKHCNFNIYETNMLNIVEKVNTSISNKETSIYIPTDESNFAWVPLSWDNYELFLNNNITPYKIGYDCDGGVIIGGREDLSILISYDIDNLSMDMFVDIFYKIIIKYFPNAIIDNNDILIDNKKVMGCVSMLRNGIFCFMAFFSFCDRSDLINILCPSKSNKRTGYIDTNILSKNALKEELLLCLR